MAENIIMVDENDVMIGTIDKMRAHITGKLHRAFSIFIFNSRGELLLQQRALSKYHSGGKWTNTCCSHPNLGEETLSAAHRRLEQEMGMACELAEKFSFTYRSEMENGLIEHEFDHVFFGKTDVIPIPNSDEVADFKYISLAVLEQELLDNPDDYTQWLKICFKRAMEFYNQIEPTNTIYQ